MNFIVIFDVNFFGKVIEVVSGDCIVVVDDVVFYGILVVERCVNLFSIWVFWVGNLKKDEKFVVYVCEVKEYFCGFLIG